MVGIWWHKDIFDGRGSKVLALAFCCLLLLSIVDAGARELEVLRVRTHADVTHTRVVLDLNGAASYEVFRKESSGDVIVRVDGARHAQLVRVDIGGNLLQAMDLRDYEGGAEVALVLAGQAKFKYFFLAAYDGAPNRIVIDLYPVKGGGLQGPPVPKPSGRSDGLFTVILDPGHGGLDSGAIRGKVEEKDVVLDIALRVQKLLSRHKGFKTILTRVEDVYPSLESRVILAEQAGGDVLLSIHCNTHSSASVHGTEVYCQSLAGAQERKLEDLLVDGRPARTMRQDTSIENDDELAGILLDVYMGQVMRRSALLAEHLLVQVESDPGMSRRSIRQGQYKILDSLSMPAALVEVAFMSNAEELKILASPAGRQRVAKLLAKGIISWKEEQEGYNP